ncbi:uncharacterized protein LOC129895609 [Solanum dulcamara]|uniref:uncharacterized protein LOC129895609 n=1 Tax=Solanum dulcamara TaxID=45834 RepID=UPI002485E07E|nr:uncharacterized protein LOC129895609 [Solanum dulcamara]
MAMNSEKILLATIIIFMLVLSPVVRSSADRMTRREVLVRRPICPACVCCQPPPSGSCCSCCATPIHSQSNNSSP